MQYRKFGNTSLTVSEIGFGAWAIGGGAMVGDTAIGWGNADDATSIQAIHAALDAGITFFDTADIYGLGHSETLLGNTIGKNKDVVLATKVGNVARNGQFTTDYTKEYIINACEASLRRLQRDTIDYYQLHSARVPQLTEGSCIEAMQQLQQEGKIRYWGLSLNTFDAAPEADYLMQNNMGSGFQLVLNIINQRALGIIKSAGEKGYGVIARMPLQFGLLTGKFNEATVFDTTDHRRNRLSADVISESNKAMEPVWRMCEKYNTTKAALALSYILSYDIVSTVIPGIRTSQQVTLNTNGLVTLSAADRMQIESMGATVFEKLMQLIQSKG